MSCRQCQGISSFFDDRVAARERKKYRKRGPDKSTRLLIEALREHAGEARTLLDIGGGIGAIQHAFVGDGFEAGVSVDASPAYLHTARAEAEERGYVHKMRYLEGDFLAHADAVSEADVVTLDRVICCFDDMEALVTASAGKARRLYGLVFPRVNVLTRPGFRMLNLMLRLRRSAFRTYLHPTERVDALVRARGLHLVTYRQTLLWQVRVYGR